MDTTSLTEMPSNDTLLNMMCGSQQTTDYSECNNLTL